MFYHFQTHAMSVSTRFSLRLVLVGIAAIAVAWAIGSGLEHLANPTVHLPH
jgi:hypothetical protein